MAIAAATATTSSRTIASTTASAATATLATTRMATSWALAAPVTRFDAVLGDLADVQQAVGAGEDFYKGAEVGQAHDLAQISLANLCRCGEVANHLQRLGG